MRFRRTIGSFLCGMGVLALMICDARAAHATISTFSLDISAGVIINGVSAPSSQLEGWIITLTLDNCSGCGTGSTPLLTDSFGSVSFATINYDSFGGVAGNVALDVKPGYVLAGGFSPMVNFDTGTECGGINPCAISIAFNVQAVPIPEPTGALLFTVGLVAVSRQLRKGAAV